jgi:hypothetical protein
MEKKPEVQAKSRGSGKVSGNGALANYRRQEGLTMMGISNNTEWYH